MSLLLGLVILIVANVATIGVMLLIRRRAQEGSYFAGSSSRPLSSFRPQRTIA
jgi:hypothetical protein